MKTFPPKKARKSAHRRPPFLSLIVAVGEDGAFGERGSASGLPWSIPKELHYFKKVTLGKTILMGRKTFEALGKPLKGRRNIILSKTTTLLKNAEVAESLEAALSKSRSRREVLLIGGLSLLEQAHARARRIYFTRIEKSFPKADVRLCEHLDPRNDSRFVCVAKKRFAETEGNKSGIAFTTEIWERQRPPLPPSRKERRLSLGRKSLRV